MLLSLLLAFQITLASSLSFVPSRANHFSISSQSTTHNVDAQPRCAPNRSFLEMKVSKGKSKHSKSNSLHTTNQYRKRIAGKPGSKHFLDPNKVFVGNLSFDATVDDLKAFLKQHLGGLNSVESVKIIHDWKTNKSKGFGFVQFYDPIFATSAMESIKNKKLKGRVIRLDQGRKKDDLENRVLFVKKRERRDEDTDKETKEDFFLGFQHDVTVLKPSIEQITPVQRRELSVEWYFLNDGQIKHAINNPLAILLMALNQLEKRRDQQSLDLFLKTKEKISSFIYAPTPF